MSRSAGSANQGARSPARRAARVLAFALGAGAALAAAGAVVLVAQFAWYGRDLPSFEALADYRPPQVTRLYDRTGAPVAELFRERRTLVPREKIPLVVKQAVLAAEDASYYEHRGLDYVGILRALVMDVRHLRLAQGASTITQQVVKNMVLSSERSVARKIKEAILARRLEQNLSKEDILWLYLNHIYFGHGRHGIEEASRFYFGKGVSLLSLGEAAVLAGLPQSPAKLSPLFSPQKAKARQTYVLNQMAANGFVTRAQADAEITRPIAIAPTELESAGPYYVEEVRRQLVDHYGEEAVYGGGLRVELAMDAVLQRKADGALARGLEDLDRRFGFRPSELAVAPDVLKAARELMGRRFDRPLPSRDPANPPRPVWDFASAGADAVRTPEAFAHAAEVRALQPNAVLVVPVQAVSDDAAVLDLGRTTGTIPFDRMKWARPWAPGKASPSPKSAKDVLKPGQLVRVRVRGPLPPSAATAASVPLDLEPRVLVQGALVAIDPATRQVVALAGGYDFEASPFNRATQAKRQPGSAFKPVVYAAAIASGRYTAASILNDAPDPVRDPWTGKVWNPQNFEKDVFEGPMTLRDALSKSKNTVSVRLIESLGPQAAIDMARRLGVTSPLPENLTLALGTGEVSPLELTNAYATLAAQGRRAEPLLVQRVVDASGRVLEEHHTVPEETVPPSVAFVTASLMQSVVETGTGMKARELGRPVAGKTGTASEHRDAWFAGFTPDLVAAAWVGFDDHSPLGSQETGGHAALPIWLAFMRGALENRERLEFAVPSGVEQVRIDPATGLRAQEDAPGRAEVFAEGTAPKAYAVRPGEASPHDLFLEDRGKKWR